MFKQYLSIVPVFLIILYSPSCIFIDKPVESYNWKLSDISESKLEDDSIRRKRHIDVLFFNKKQILKENTIYRSDIPYAKIIKHNNRMLGSHSITIVEFETLDTLRYVAK